MDAAASEAYPVVTLQYRCRCGRTACSHGVRAGYPPRGWAIVGGAADVLSYVCPSCQDTDKPAPNGVEQHRVA
jgi:hypothetical protein